MQHLEKLQRQINWLIKQVKCLKGECDGGTSGGGLTEQDVINIINNLNISATVSRDIVANIKSGAIDISEVVNEGTDLTSFIEQLLLDTYYPNFEPPTYNLTLSGSNIREVGEPYDDVLTGIYNSGKIKGKIVNGVWDPNAMQTSRAGNANSYTFNGINNGTGNSFPVTGTVHIGSNTFTSIVSYSQGPQPKDSENKDFGTPLPPGTLNSTITMIGSLYVYFGAFPSIPGEAAIKSQLNKHFIASGNKVVINSGINHHNMGIFLPVGTKVIFVEDLDDPNAPPLTNDYALYPENQPPIVYRIPDASGVLHDYNLFLRTALPYTKNHRHQITIQ